MDKRIIVLQETQKHPKGDIVKGSIYKEERKGFFVHRNSEGVMISAVNLPAIELMPSLFKMVNLKQRR